VIRERDVTTLDGRVLRTAELGPAGAPAVLWHHGNPGSRVPPLSEAALDEIGVRLITYDRPGGGLSTPNPGRCIADGAADDAAIADAWGVERFAAAGVSGGGAYALGDAALLPGRVVAAAVLGGAAPIDAEGLDFTDGITETNRRAVEEPEPTDRATPLAEIEPLRQAILADPRAVLREFSEEFPPADREALTDPSILDPIAEGMAECVRISAEGWLDDSLAFGRPWGFDPATIAVPVEIWHGRDDTASPLAHARWLAGRIPGAELHELDGGHYAGLLRLSQILGRLAAR
jgi:pimeloyl-ACP methyl ester carboxylesterase